MRPINSPTLINDQPHYAYLVLPSRLAAVGINCILLYFPLLEGTPKSSLCRYAKDWNLRVWAMMAGFFCSAGNLAEFIGGQVSSSAVLRLHLQTTLF
jgi:hypothetical protein